MQPWKHSVEYRENLRTVQVPDIQPERSTGKKYENGWNHVMFHGIVEAQNRLQNLKNGNGGKGSFI